MARLIEAEFDLHQVISDITLVDGRATVKVWMNSEVMKCSACAPIVSDTVIEGTRYG
jgi:hypothetical protein